MFLKLPFRRLAKPSYVSMMALLMSFSAWLLPSFGVLRKGFDHPQQLDLISVTTLASWYLLIFLGFTVGQKAGELLRASLPSKNASQPLESDAIYWSFTALTAIGTTGMVLKIFSSLSTAMVLFYIGSGQANLIGEALHDDYSVGIVSLRYLVVYSASLTLCRIITRKKITVVNGLNLLMLLVIMTARLIFIATVLMTIFQLNFDKKLIRISILKAAALFLVAFSALSAVNISRNGGYYTERGSSFYGAGISEAVAYLGSPFQVSVGTAKVLDELEGLKGQSYRRYVDVEESLNSNSAFVYLFASLGSLAWLYMVTVCFFMGLMFSFMRSLGKTAFLLPCGAILYASSELWRLDMFRMGIFITWFVCGIGVPLGLLTFSRIHSQLVRAYPARPLID